MTQKTRDFAMSATPDDTTAPWALALAFGTRLPDGSRVLVRPITPADKAKIAAALDQLSARSRLFRFGATLDRLSPEELAHLTELDYRTHVAWGALAIDLPGEPGIAVARFIRHPEDPGTAECAITVIDAWQRRGLGKVLLQTLLVSAAEQGVERLVRRVHPENEAAVQLVRSMGGRVSPADGGALLLEVPVQRLDRHLLVSQQVLPRVLRRDRQS
jgi:GNAT superfamily N-acetyltransferase